mmetsp:Transcript_47063/g.112031  ORF Transcript_47063/g.112031 Transcript_47063/m.112031 type:complete len:213 (-) Transcript_47063:2049-2687(-)
MAKHTPHLRCRHRGQDQHLLAPLPEWSWTAACHEQPDTHSAMVRSFAIWLSSQALDHTSLCHRQLRPSRGTARASQIASSTHASQRMYAAWCFVVAADANPPALTEFCREDKSTPQCIARTLAHTAALDEGQSLRSQSSGTPSSASKHPAFAHPGCGTPCPQSSSGTSSWQLSSSPLEYVGLSLSSTQTCRAAASALFLWPPLLSTSPTKPQ